MNSEHEHYQPTRIMEEGFDEYGHRSDPWPPELDNSEDGEPPPREEEDVETASEEDLQQMAEGQYDAAVLRREEGA